MIHCEWSSQIVYVRKPLPSGGAHIKDYTSHSPGERAVQSAIQNPYIFVWVYEAEAPLPNFCSHTCFDHILEGGQRLILYVCICFFFFFANVPCSTCTEVGSGSYMVELFVLGAWGRGGKRIHQNLFTRRGTLRRKRHRQILFFFFFWRKEGRKEGIVPTVKHPGVSHCPHLYKQPQLVDKLLCILGCSQIGLVSEHPTQD